MFPKTHFIGFDSVLSNIESLATNVVKYPPHNIVDVGENNFIIEMAIAGFSKDEVTIKLKHNVLSIIGEKSSDDKNYIHKGISTKSFQRQFALAENVTVENADVKDGMLIINLKTFEDNGSIIPIGKPKSR